MKKLISYLLLTCLLISPAWGADEWLTTRPALTGDQWTAWPAASQANNKSLDRLLSNYREGMKLTYSSATTISVAAGEAMCSNSAGTVRKMRQNTSATNVTFSDIDTGSEASSTTYYLYAVADADATTATFKISASSTAPTGVTYYKRLGSFYNDASSNVDQYSISNDNGIDTAKVYDSGWFSVAASGYYAKTHGLGSTKVIGIVLFSTASDGSGLTTAFPYGQFSSHDAGATTMGVVVSTLTTTTVNVVIGTGGVYLPASTTSSAVTAATSGYARIILQRLD